jgi:hypothetical protein
MFSGILTAPLPHLIGITGRARAGKDTLGDQLCQLGGYYPLSFALPLKMGLIAMFGWDQRHVNGELKEVVDPELGISPRVAMQTLGTEWAREVIGADVWVKVMGKRIKASPHPRIVITDVRFPNEAAYIRANGVLVHVERSLAPEVAKHSSEATICPAEGDFVFNNDGPLETVRFYASTLLGHLAERMRD